MKLQELFDENNLPWKKGDIVIYLKDGKNFSGKIINISRAKKYAEASIEEGIFDVFKNKKYKGIIVAIKSLETGKLEYIDASQIISKK